MKAPDLVVDISESDQLDSYASAVVQDARFSDTNTEWDFWLVTGEMTERLRQRSSQKDRPRGLLFEPDLPGAPHAKVRIWVRTWGEIIEDAKRRLSYFQDQLHHDPSFDEARDYLRRNHGNVIPEALLAEQTNENQDNGNETPSTPAAEKPTELTPGGRDRGEVPSGEGAADSPNE